MADNNELFVSSKQPGLFERLAALRVPFPPEKISKKPRGGAMLDYVGHADITERLLDIDPEWNWQPCQWEDGAPKFVIGSNGKPVGLWIRLTVCGVTRLGYGSVEPGAVDAEKQLIGDALRNAAMRFGVALELWSKTERSQSSSGPAVMARRETQIVPPPTKTERQRVESMADAVEAAFAGNDQIPFDVPTDSAESQAPYGIPINVPFDPSASSQVVIPFGKHKGKTLGELSSNNEGRGYLRWLVNNIKESYSKGKNPKSEEQHALVVAMAAEISL